MALKDSFDKITQSYFSAVTSQDFEYKNIIYKPKKLKISSLIWRTYDCPPMCGACCSVFSLDYLPDEDKPKEVKERTIIFNKKKFNLYSDFQKENKNHHCKYITKKGRCSIHKFNPFSCDFELIRFLHYSDASRPNLIIQKIYGRAWNMLKVDGKRGASCQKIESKISPQSEIIRKLIRLKEWCDYFELKNNVALIIREIKYMKGLIY